MTRKSLREALVTIFAISMGPGLQAAGGAVRVIQLGGYLDDYPVKHEKRAGAAPAAVAVSAVPGIRSISNWGSTFAYKGVTYPYIMAGTSPASGAAANIGVALLSVRVVMGDGEVFYPGDTIERSLDSPVFADTDYVTGRGQYVDAVMRASFWNSMPAGRNWHLRLSPSVRNEVTLNVPDDYGVIVVTRTGLRVAVVDFNYFAYVLESIVAQNTSFTSFVAGLLRNVVLSDVAGQADPLAHCCTFGFHTYTNETHSGAIENVQTWGFASWVDAGFFKNPNVADVASLSHELAEWAFDPFVNNVVPGWLTPSAPQYGCTGYLETGDPLVGYSTPVTIDGFTYHPQTEALFQWFARVRPSDAVNRSYSFPDPSALTSLPADCVP